MAASDNSFILGIFSNGCFSKIAAKIYFRNPTLHTFYICYSDVMLKRNEFLWNFF